MEIAKTHKFQLWKANKKKKSKNYTTAMLWDREAWADSTVLKTTYAWELQIIHCHQKKGYKKFVLIKNKATISIYYLLYIS